MADLLHVTDEKSWDAAQRQGGYGVPEGGFIHLCTEEQLAFVLEVHFAGRGTLLLLHVDSEGRDVRWEHSEPGMDPFPHLYEPLPVEAVTRVERV